MKQFKVRDEFLVDENNKIAKMTLAEWAEYFGLKMVDGTSWAWKTRDGKFIDVEKRGGYGLLHSEFGKYADTVYFVGNADLNRMKLRPYD